MVEENKMKREIVGRNLRAGLMLVIALGAASPAVLWAGGARETTIRTAPTAHGGPEGAETDGRQNGSERAGTGAIPVVLEVREGVHYMHRLKVMPLIRVKNHPQMVAWCETADGEFLTTLFITRRTATQSWRGAPGDPTPKEEIRRKESLPVWSHRRGKVYTDGLHLPTREEPMPDTVTGATPTSGFTIRTQLPAGLEKVAVYFEVNNSTDFNETYTEDAAPGSDTYSGGEWGSGQPSLVYRAVLDPADLPVSAGGAVSLELLGRSTPDGSTGEIHGELSGITTAFDIIEDITISGANPRSR
jgi:hypothetical protein